MMNLSLLNYMNVIAYIANVAVTYGIGVAGIGGLSNNSELSEKYQTLITPIGFSFAIWGIIFSAQLVFVIVQLLPAFRATPLVANAIGYHYVNVCFSQITWTLAFSFEIIWLSLLAMIAILYFLLSLVNDQYKEQDKTSFRDYWLLKFPFSIHCGWILAALSVNISVVLVSQDVSADVQYYVALGTLAMLVLVSSFSVSFPNRPEYVIPAVLAWASFGIYMELSNPKDLIVNSFDEDRIHKIKIGALFAIIVILVNMSLKLVSTIIKGWRSGGEDDNESGYSRYEDGGASRASQSASRASKKSQASKNPDPDDAKSTSPSVTSGLTDVI